MRGGLDRRVLSYWYINKSEWDCLGREYRVRREEDLEWGILIFISCVNLDK